ncbi:N-acetyl sugar amidotransferase [Niastella caeni]|uniref:N-acetyl sugar amidotransferase n=1 Tax=Niastella caeni TaxID=2569763 RepID=A0A4S8I1F6_9BACT|nr:N-acetyl sugar amidotransferase [Niastella caeni]THU41521.1 N-acetyl sugar amidotransferase [Niastella caeni]
MMQRYDEEKLKRDTAINFGKPYQQCALSVMDTIADPDISFDENGICNYYYDYKEAAAKLPKPGQREEELDRLVKKIKEDGKGKKYNCIIGLSGGVDSSYVAYLTRKYDLNPLAVHLDNGWNSELAVSNIENIIKKLNIDLYTLVVDWDEFKDIQLAYLRASVVDIEVVSDHAIFSTMYKLSRQYNIPYILSGTNVVTEHTMPRSWLYSKMDFRNLKDIHNRFGKRKIKTFPTLPFWKFIYFNAVLRLQLISVLNYMDYNKKEVKKIIASELNWRDYGGKHYESIFTKFYQAYILPVKFSIDKRKSHLSNLIFSGQITKEEAMQELQLPLYKEDELAEDMSYVIKKFQLTQQQFDEMMKMPPQPHQVFKSDLGWKQQYLTLLERTAPIRRILKPK